jgi:hypothetical protein
MAWTDIPLSHINFGLFEANPASATVSVAAGDLLLFRYKELSRDTLIVDFKISKIFFNPRNAAASGITMELKIPYGSVHFPSVGSPSSFFDTGQTYSNDCVIAIDPGSINHVPGCVVVLNEVSHKIVLMVRDIPNGNVNASAVGVFGTFGQITFEVTSKGKHEDGEGTATAYGD